MRFSSNLKIQRVSRTRVQADEIGRKNSSWLVHNISKPTFLVHAEDGEVSAHARSLFKMEMGMEMEVEVEVEVQMERETEKEENYVVEWGKHSLVSALLFCLLLLV